jgi:DNA-binding LacI/PurR family transcriptional regulator
MRKRYEEMRNPGGRAGEIVNVLRGRIISGEYPRGGQMPTFDQMVGEFGLSRATVQLAIRHLREEGFVTSMDRRGLFVVENPPHLCRFGLVFPSAPGERRWTRFAAALQAEALVLERQRAALSFELHHDVAARGDPAHSRAVIEAALHHRVAGLVLVRGTGHLVAEGNLLESGIHCAGINYDPDELPGVPLVNTDPEMFYRKALLRLGEMGRKRVAIVTGSPKIVATPEMFARAGLHTKDHWLCRVSPESEGAPNVVQLLFDYEKEERPDALIIGTDALVEDALGTLHQMEMLVGRDLDVVAHCNWPWPVRSPLPIERLGFHMHDFLDAAMRAISLQREGEAFAPLCRVPAVFENELGAHMERRG